MDWLLQPRDLRVISIVGWAFLLCLLWLDTERQQETTQEVVPMVFQHAGASVHASPSFPWSSPKPRLACCSEHACPWRRAVGGVSPVTSVTLVTDEVGQISSLHPVTCHLLVSAGVSWPALPCERADLQGSLFQIQVLCHSPVLKYLCPLWLVFLLSWWCILKNKCS